MDTSAPRPNGQGQTPSYEAGGFALDRAAQAALIVIAVVAFAWFLSWARPILLPVAAAIVVGMILGPAADRGAAYGVPRIATNLGVLIAFAALIYAAVALFIPSIVSAAAQLPEFAAQVREKLGALHGLLDRLKNFEGIFTLTNAPSVQVSNAESRVAELLGYVTPAFAQLVIFAFTLIFFLTGRTRIKRQIVLAFRGRENRLTALKIISEIESKLLNFFATVTVINAGVGVLTALYLTVIGAPGPLIWGFLAFVLNFLPVIGPLMMEALLLGMGVIVMPSLSMAVLPVLGYLAIVLVEGNFITPQVLGKRLTIEPLMVFLMICILTWLWGPVGALLSTPILSIAMISAEHLWGTEEVALPG